MANLVPDTKTNIFYQGAKEKQLGDREVIVPSGGVLGGGSSTNLMMYSRAQRSDFDSWDVPGWSADEMLPYLKKVCFASHPWPSLQSTLHTDTSMTAGNLPWPRFEWHPWL
jgi:choline dehydrogenase-like flavoprotein